MFMLTLIYLCVLQYVAKCFAGFNFFKMFNLFIPIGQVYF